jgi:serine/threonine-protein kinase RsbW
MGSPLLRREWTFNDDTDINGVQDALETEVRTHMKQLQMANVADRRAVEVGLALREALVNHIKHGNQLDRSKKVTVTAVLADGVLEVESSDEGPGFDPEDVPDPTAVENLDRNCGRGLLMMRHYAGKRGGSVEYLGNGNRLRMRFVLEVAPEEERS